MELAPVDVYPAGRGAPPYQVIDVRAPVEVARGALPGALAMPLLGDEERRQVGVRYKEAGQPPAIELGYELLGPTLPARVAAWRGAVEAAPVPTALACWRGGLRSELVARFIDLPQRVERVAGGYKALRAHLLAGMEAALARKQLIVLAGLTGSGKTRLLRCLVARSGGRAKQGALQVLDLEGLARHRGSAFGHEAAAQPSQQTFENALAAELVLHPATRLVVEDESRFVGRRSLPDALYAAMARAPLVVLEADLPARAREIYREYVDLPTRSLGREAVAADLRESTLRLRARLGAATTEAITERLADLAADGAGAWADPLAHEEWISTLLAGHYDPLYRRALKRLARPVLFRGDAEAVAAWLDGAP